jgi:Uma2 family endonuclease
LENFLRQHSVGEVFAAPYDVVLSDVDVVEPDLLLVSSSRQTIITERNVQGPPDLVVEILSDSTRKTDEVIQRKLYERYGVKEYWIIDPELETIKIHRKDQNGYTLPVTLDREQDDQVATPLLPSFQVPLPELFE